MYFCRNFYRIKMFLAVFGTTLSAIAKVFLVAAAAGFMVRRNIVNMDIVKALSEATVKVFLPALTFSNVLTTFRPADNPQWWILPLIGFVVPVLFMAITALFYLADIRANMNKFPIAALQNVGYLVLPVGQILYPQEFDRFALYVFLLILGFNIALWTVGKVLISYQKGKTEFRLSEMVTPPFVANVVAILMVFAGMHKVFPDIILQPIEILGQAAIPLGMFILGATLGSISLRSFPPLLDIVKIGFVKYVLMPGFAVVLLLKVFPQTNGLLSDVLVIEASAAPAANLLVIVQKYGGDYKLVASLVFIMYLLAVIAMPVWLALWQYLVR